MKLIDEASQGVRKEEDIVEEDSSEWRDQCFTIDNGVIIIIIITVI